MKPPTKTILVSHPRILRRFLRGILLLLTLLLVAGCESPSVERPAEPNTVPTGSTEADGLPVSTIPKKRVALTFDDGPQHANDEETKLIVDELEKYGFHATFFVLGNRIAGGDALNYAVEHGNEIGIHGLTHQVYYDECTDEEYWNELNDTHEKIVKRLPDYDVRLMRPIGGKITAERLSSCPYSVIMWSVDSEDWKNKSPAGDAEKINTIVENVMSTVSDGDVILMHDIYYNTYEAVKIILERLYDEGYEVVTVSELFGNDLQPAQKYYSTSGTIK